MLKVEINQSLLKGGQRLSGQEIEWLMRAFEQVLGLRENWEISLAFVGKPEMKRLNSAWRGKNEPTDVLSFAHRQDGLLGEILICYPVAHQQALEKGVPLKAEIRLLITHGVLHLLGYDHAGPKQTQAMQALEERILKKYNQLCSKSKN